MGRTFCLFKTCPKFEIRDVCGAVQERYERWEWNFKNGDAPCWPPPKMCLLCKGHRRVVPNFFFNTGPHMRLPLAARVHCGPKKKIPRPPPRAVNRTLGRVITTHTRGFAARARRP